MSGDRGGVMDGYEKKAYWGSKFWAGMGLKEQPEFSIEWQGGGGASNKK